MLVDPSLDGAVEGDKSSGDVLIVDAILKAFEDVAPVFTIALPVFKEGKMSSEEVEFQVLNDNVKWNEATAFCQAWVSEKIKLHEKNLLRGRFKKEFEPDRLMLGRVALLYHLAITPAWKSDLAWLVLARNANSAFMAIYNQVTKAAVPSLEQLSSEELEKEKKD